MSEDLRYYFFDNEPDKQPPISAEAGWNNMRQMLDAEMPVSSKGRKHRFAFWISAALVGVSLIFLSTRLYNNNQQGLSLTQNNKPVIENKEATTENNIVNTQQDKAVTEIEQSTNNSKPDNLVTKQNGVALKHNTVPFTTAKSLANNDKQQTLATINNHQPYNEPFNINNVNSAAVTNNTVEENTAIKNGVAVNEESKESKETTATTADAKKKKNAETNVKPGSWQINAGAAMNFSLSNTLKGLQPFPFAEVKYNVTPKFFVSGSVALLSPVASKASGVKKTVYVNDTSVDVSRYNEKLNFKTLTYADVALTAGINLSKRFSVNAGLQASRLITTKQYTSLDPYDFASNRVNVVDIAGISPNPSAAPVYNNQVDARKLDLRYVAGINYNINKLSFSLQYQGSTKPILKGESVSNTKNQLINLRVAYRFK